MCCTGGYLLLSALSAGIAFQHCSIFLDTHHPYNGPVMVGAARLLLTSGAPGHASETCELKVYIFCVPLGRPHAACLASSGVLAPWPLPSAPCISLADTPVETPLLSPTNPHD